MSRILFTGEDLGAGASGALSGAAAGAAIGNVPGAIIGGAIGGVTGLLSSRRTRNKTRDAESRAKERIRRKRRHILMQKYQARRQEQNLASGGMRRRSNSRGATNQDGNILAMDNLIHSSGTFGQ